MRTSASRLGPQLFVLVGPLASRMAASLLPPLQSAVVNQLTATSTTRILLEATNSTQTQNLSSALSQQLGGAAGLFSSQQHADGALNYTAAPHQQHRHIGHIESVELQLQQQQQELATSEALMNSLNANSNYNQQARSLAATLARLAGWELVLVIALVSLILISIVGNCLVCVAIFTDRRLRKLGNAFIVSLAIADLFVSCLVMTFALCNDLMDWWMFGERFCDIWISFDIMCCTASILNLCAISLDRFIHIKDCLLYNQLMTRRVALGAVLGIWLISALVSFVPINLGWHKPDHFKSWPTQPQPAPLRTQNFAAAPLMSAGVSINETHDAMLVEANDNLMHGQRARRQTTPFGLDGSPAASENSGVQGAVAATSLKPQHLNHYTQFAQLATHEFQSAPAGGCSANKDFVPTKRRPAQALAGTGRRSSSGLDGHAEASSSRSPAAQEDLGGGSRTPSWPANYYDPNQLASETGGPKQSDDQVEFNPPDGPSGGREQIKPQLRKKRLAAESPAAQTDHSSRSPASLDHADERPPMGEMGHSSMSPIGNRLQAHSLGAGPASHRKGPEKRPLEQTTGGGPGDPGSPDGFDGSGANPAGSQGHLLQCMLTLTPTYAIISSTISFYIPCLIMLGLYSKLFACARRHVRNIRAITRAPHPIATTTGPLTPQAAAAAATAPGNGASAPTHLNTRPPNTSANSSSSCRDGKESGPPLASRARTWIKFAMKRSPGGSGAHCAASESSGQRGCSQTQPVGPLACRNTSTSGASSSSSSSSPANDRRASCSPSPPIAQRLSTTSGADEKTIDRAPAREDEPFLSHQTGERGDKPASSKYKNYCDNANDSPLTQSPSNEGKFVSRSTGVKLKLAPSEFQHRQQQAAAAAAATAATLASQLQQQQHKQQQTSQLATHKAAITLGIIMGTFLFCWVPFFCLNIIKAFYVDSIPGSMFRAFTWLGYANSALNPIIYGIHNSEFRNAFNRIFFKHLTLKNGRHYLNRRFSYDLRPHHHQAREQQQQQHHHHHHHNDHHYQHQSYHATSRNTSCAPSGAPGAGSTNHQLAARPHVSTDKRQTSRPEEVRALVDHQQTSRVGFHKGQRGQQQFQEQSTPLPRNFTTFHPIIEQT